MRYVILFFVALNVVMCGYAVAGDTSVETARQLFKNGDIAKAAIAFYTLQRDGHLAPPIRKAMGEQFSASLELLRSDPRQTDRFGSLISSQKNNQFAQTLTHHYASLLQAQHRYTKMAEVLRYICRLWPCASNRYAFASKMDKAGEYEQAYELYQDLLGDKRYRTMALRNMLDILKYLEDGNNQVALIMKRYRTEIFNNYDLMNSLINTCIWHGRIEDTLIIVLEMAQRYPYSLQMLIYKLIPLCQKGTLSSETIENLIESKGDTLTEQQRYLLAKLLATSGDIERAVEVLGCGVSLKNMEYRADLLYSAGRFNKASDLYKALLNNGQPNPAWFQKLAEIAFKSGDISGAREYLNQYLEYCGKTSFNAYFYVGKILERNGLADEAEKVYVECKNKSKNRTMVVLELIKYYLHQKKFDKAAREILDSQTNIQINPKSLYLSIKDALANQLDMQHLIDELDRLVNEKILSGELPNYPQRAMYYCLYVFSDEIAHIDKAVHYYKKYFVLTQGKEVELLNFCARLENNGFTDEALELLALIQPESRYFNQAVRKRAQILINTGNMREAVKLFQDYPAIKDTYLMAQAYFLMGQIGRAQNVIARASHKTAPMFLLQGDIYLVQKKFDKAIHAYKSVSHADLPLYIKSRFALAKTYLFMDKFDMAVALFEQICERYVYSSQANEALKLRKIMALMEQDKNRLTEWAHAEFLYWKHDFKQALKEYNRIIGENKNGLYVPDMIFRVSDILIKLGRTDEAVAELEKIVAHFPQSSMTAQAEKMALDLKEKSGGYNKKLYIQYLNLYPDTYDADLVRDKLSRQDNETVSAGGGSL